ncbi:MAG: asparagine synthase C-terminal domain-containing protein [Rhodospirillales bacterium]
MDRRLCRRRQRLSLAAFFRDGLEDVTAGTTRIARAGAPPGGRGASSPTISTGRITTAITPADQAPAYPPDFDGWEPLHQAQYLEITTFMSPYLLSSQGDRMTMANAVEGRFPFLDHRVIDFCNRLPPRLKLRGLTEKYLLKQLSRRWLPEEIWQRPKRPFRAPIHRSFFNDARLDWVEEMLAPERIAAYGLFKPAAVRQLRAKVEAGGRLGETDDMALVGILSSQLIVDRFISGLALSPPLDERDDVRVCTENRAAA